MPEIQNTTRVTSHKSKGYRLLCLRVGYELWYDMYWGLNFDHIHCNFDVIAACQLCCKCYIWFFGEFCHFHSTFDSFASDSSHVPGPAAAAVTTHRGELWRFGSQLWEGGQEYAGTATPREAGKGWWKQFFWMFGIKSLYGSDAEWKFGAFSAVIQLLTRVD